MVGAVILCVPTLVYGALILCDALFGTVVSTLGDAGSPALCSGDVYSTLEVSPGLCIWA